MSSGAAESGGRLHRMPALVRAAAWFRGFHTQLGWLVIGLGVALFWMTTSWSDLRDFRSPLGTAPGLVVKRLETHVQHPGARAYKYGYSFVGPDGEAYSGWCYGDDPQVEAGGTVTVEFPAGRPGISRIRGMRRGLLETQHWSTYVVFAAGLALLTLGMSRGLAAGARLASGKMAEAVLVSRDRTGQLARRVAEAGLPRVPILYTLTVEFVADDGQTYETVCRTYRPGDLVKAGGLQVLYAPGSPSSSVVLQGMPGAPRVGEDGVIKVTSVGRALARLALPVLVTAALVGYLVLRYGIL